MLPQNLNQNFIAHLMSQILFVHLNQKTLFSAPEIAPAQSNWRENEWQDYFADEVYQKWNLLNAKMSASQQLQFAEAALRSCRWLQDDDAHFLPIDCDRYPALLKEISDPPLGLFLKGEPHSLANARTAVVGSRKANAHALKESFLVARGLAAQNQGVISGGAFGCDIAAHEGVLSLADNPGPAIVVFAGGLNHLYPSQNAHTFSDILQRNGALISERLPWLPARAYDFPIRNRIISGIAESILVMQADLKSGAMVTARRALQQGREVYVLMHEIDDVRAMGSHALLHDGALGFQTANDFLKQDYVALRAVLLGNT